MTKEDYTRSGRAALAHVPVAVGRPRVAARALRLLPLAGAGGAHAPRLERVPEMEAAAHPAVAGARLPVAARTADPRALLARLVFVLRPDRDLRAPRLAFEEQEPGPRLSLEELERHRPSMPWKPGRARL